MRSKKVLLILAGGGFLGQMKQIMKNLDCDDSGIHYVTAEDSTSILRSLESDKCFVMPKTTHFSTRNPFIRVKDFFRSLIKAYSIINEIKPDFIISVGSSMAIPLFLCSIKYQSKKIFIESLTRVNDLSRTGKIIYNFNLSDKFYVQWPELSQVYPKSVYRGKVL